MLDKRQIFAFWLYTHPNIKISDYNNGKTTYFWYDNETHEFYYHTPQNKVRNGVGIARGLKCAFKAYLKHVCDGGING